MDLIKTEDVSFGYNGSEDTISNINMTVAKGDFICVVGENGSR